MVSRGQALRLIVIAVGLPEFFEAAFAPEALPVIPTSYKRRVQVCMSMSNLLHDFTR